MLAWEATMEYGKQGKGTTLGSTRVPRTIKVYGK